MNKIDTPMMLEHQPITDLSQVTPAWLTATLQRAGYLADSQVSAIAFGEQRQTSFHTVVQMQVTYSHATAAPPHLFLKFSLPERQVQVAENGWEVKFYRDIASQMKGGPLIRCYDAVFSPPQKKLHLVLEDLTATHYAQEPSHLPPLLPDCERIVDALAEFHAAWWERPPFAVVGWQLPDETELAARIEGIHRRIHAFQAMLGDRLSGQRRAIYQTVLAGLPTLFRRLKSVQGMAVVHDDIHIGNFLYPHDPSKDKVRMLDWQTWTIDLAVKDLAHMLAYFWFPERRSQCEQPLLHYYHERLQAYGVTNYSWEMLYNDYRLCVIRKLFHPAWQWENGENTNKWWFHHERIMLAYQDLGCAELVD